MRIAKLNKFTDIWIKEYSQGLSTIEIAKKYEVGHTTVQKYLNGKIILRTIRETKLGSKNPNWRGDKVGVIGLHTWLGRNLPKPKVCQECKVKKPLDVANVSPKYDKSTYTRDFKNWRWLCRSCHMTSDGRMKNLEDGRVFFKSKGHTVENV